MKPARRLGEIAAPWIVFSVAFVVYLVSPIHEVADSKYTLLFSENLLHTGSFSAPRTLVADQIQEQPDGSHRLSYHFVEAGNRVHYLFPPGSPVLALPGVAMANLLGLRVIDKNGAYNATAERKIQQVLAPVVAAGACLFIFLTCQLLLSLNLSLLVATAAAFGSPLWSVASRSLWSQTWGLLGFAIVLYLLVRARLKGRSPPAVALATVVSWLYFIRPTFSVVIAAVTVYIFFCHRGILLPYLLTGLAWCALLVAFSLYHFGTILPPYYDTGRITLTNFPEALLGNLISPGRGLLVYMPVLFYVAYLLWRNRRHLPERNLFRLLIVACPLHLVVVSTLFLWYAGHSYGPRYLMDLVPAFALLAALGLKAQQSRPSSLEARLASASVGVLLLAITVAIHYVGATSIAAWWWNVLPIDIDSAPHRVWDWSNPQFLAPWTNRS